MAQLKKPIHDDGPVNAGEQRLLDYLIVMLPNNYYVISTGNGGSSITAHVRRGGCH